MYDSNNKIPGDHICPRCNRGYWTLKQKDARPNSAHWVVHACVFCIDTNAAKATENSYTQIWKEHRSVQVLDDVFMRINSPLTQMARFRARIRYLTEE